MSGMKEPLAGAEPPQDSVLARTAVGAGWMFAWRMTSRVLGLASTLILVRLLAPEDFGLFGLAFAIIATLEATMAIGVEAQIVRAKQTSRALYDTVFTIALLRSVSLTLLMLLAAGPAAGFFKDPRLEPVMLVLSAYPLLAGLSNVGAIEFGRYLNFRMIFVMLMLPRLLQIPATLTAAIVLQSYWALVIGVLAARILATLLSYLYHPYRPRLSLAMWRELIGLSLWTWVLSVAMALRDRTATFAIGRVLGPHELGVYTVSVELASLPTSEIASPISQAAMPGLAAALRSDNPRAAGDAFLRIYALTALIALPAALGVSLVAGPLVALVLGQRWTDTVPLIAILGATWVGYSVSLIGIALLDAKAMLRRLALFVLAGVVLRALAVLALAPVYGLNGLAAGLGVAMLLEAALMTHWCLNLLGLPARRLFAVLWRPLAAVAAMTALLWAAGLGWNPAPATLPAAAREGGAGVALGVASYVAALGSLWWLSGRPAGAEADMLTLVRKFLPRAMGARLLGAPR
jgi:O-antigen/teichoic acid export membrane protein